MQPESPINMCVANVEFIYNYPQKYTFKLLFNRKCKHNCNLNLQLFIISYGKHFVSCTAVEINHSVCKNLDTRMQTLKYQLKYFPAIAWFDVINLKQKSN